MSDITPKDGGPAFGGYQRLHPAADPSLDTPVMGMSLRDYFAAAVVPSAISAIMEAGSAAGATTRAARIAYEVADAMLAQRSKP